MVSHIQPQRSASAQCQVVGRTMRAMRATLVIVLIAVAGCGSTDDAVIDPGDDGTYEP